MNCKKDHPIKTMILDEFFELPRENISDTVLLVATSDSGFDCLKNIDFEPYTDEVIEGPKPGEGFVAIIDGSEKKIIWKRGKEISVDYKWEKCEFSACCRDSVDNSDDMRAYFTIDRIEIGFENKAGMKILLFSKSEDQILNLLSVDTGVCPMPIIEKTDVDVFNLERRQHLIGLKDVINPPGNKERNAGKMVRYIRNSSYHISELLRNPRKIGPYAKARLASFYCDRIFLNPDYRSALKWMNRAINSSNIDDDELTDDTSVYYAVNQFLSKRDSPETLSEKEAYFMSMFPAGGRLRILQICATIFLKMFDEICEKHSLEYWVIAGTLLGAVRHNGFIPWDDDIDVGMLRLDIQKLEKIIKEEYPNLRFERSVMVEEYKAYRHCKVLLEGLEFIFIDVFIFDIYDISVESLEERIELYNEKIYRHVDIYKRKNNINKDGPLTALQKADIDGVLSVFSGEKETLHVVEGISIGYGADTMMPSITKVKAYETGTVFPCKNIMFENIKIDRKSVV